MNQHSMSPDQLTRAMVATRHRMRACRTNHDVHRAELHARWMDNLLDEWLRRRSAGHI